MDSKSNPNIAHIAGDVLKFMRMGQAHHLHNPYEPIRLETIKLAIYIINEEVNKELLPRLELLKENPSSKELLAHILDDGTDSIYVIIWTLVAMALPFYPAWNHIQERNMAKFLPCPNCNGEGKTGIGKCNYTGASDSFKDGAGDIRNVKFSCCDGHLVIRDAVTDKIVKPATWTPPDIWSILHEVWEDIYLRQHPEILMTEKVRENFHGPSANDVTPGGR